MVSYGSSPGRWHRQQNKFAKVWEQTKITLRLVITYFNWIWVHSRLGTTAARASRPNDRTLGLARYCCLFHTLLTHDLHMTSSCFNCIQSVSQYLSVKLLCPQTKYCANVVNENKLGHSVCF